MASISKSVSDYYYLKRYQFERIDEFRKVDLPYYATKHNLEIAVIIELFKKGESEGIMVVQSELKDRSLISSEAGKFYLFEIATIYNIEARYLPSTTRYYFKKGYANFGTTHDHGQQFILAAGNEIGKYEYAWEQVLKNHLVFEPLFKPEIEKIRNDFFNRPPYPCFNVKVIGLPDTMQKAKDFRYSIIRLNEILIARSPALESKDLSNGVFPRLFNYHLIDEFKELFDQFLQETTNNMDNGVYVKYSKNYRSIEDDLKNCIQTLLGFEKKQVFEIEMYDFPGFEQYSENWFERMLKDLKFTQDIYSYITGTDKTSIVTKIVETIGVSCVEIIENQMNYDLSKNPELKNDRERENNRTFHISQKINDKLKSYIISNCQRPIGKSSTGKSSGTVDLAVQFGNELITGEALNFKDLNSQGLGKQIKEHWRKLVHNYNLSKKKNLLFLVYYEGNEFYTSYDNYKKEFEKEHSNIRIKDISKKIIGNSRAVKVAFSTHSYSENTKNKYHVYHFYINFGSNSRDKPTCLPLVCPAKSERESCF